MATEVECQEDEEEISISPAVPFGSDPMPDPRKLQARQQQKDAALRLAREALMYLEPRLGKILYPTEVAKIRAALAAIRALEEK